MPTIADLERLLAADPDDAFVIYGIAQEYAKAGQFERAVGFYDRCLSVDPAYVYAYFHKARALEALGRVQEAREALARGVDVARTTDDGHAMAELSAYLDELT